MKIIFEIECLLGNLHRVKVIVHPTRRALRRLGNYRGENSVKDADAFCWQNKRLAKDNVICEIHLAKDTLSVDDVAHEAVHCAVHRARFLGVTGKDLEEQLATDTGVLTDRIIAELTARKIKVTA